jgi:predicted patatin/cPLA2 family phospholipase
METTSDLKYVELTYDNLISEINKSPGKNIDNVGDTESSVISNIHTSQQSQPTQQSPVYDIQILRIPRTPEETRKLLSENVKYYMNGVEIKYDIMQQLIRDSNNESMSFSDIPLNVKHDMIDTTITANTTNPIDIINTTNTTTPTNTTNPTITPTITPTPTITTNTEHEFSKKITVFDTIVLSGASSLGLVTLGSLQYAQDNNMINNVKTYIGTSSGSIISYLMAIGYKPIEIITHICVCQLMNKLQHFNIVSMVQGKGAVSFYDIQEQLERMTISKIGYLPTLKNIKDKFDIKLVCVTYNIVTNTTEYVSYDNYPDLPCLIAVRMSSSLPFIFERFIYGNGIYIDGGVTKNFAIDATNPEDKTLGILLESNIKEYTIKSDINMIEYLCKLLYIPSTQTNQMLIANKHENCTVVRIRYASDKIFTFNYSTTDKMDMFSSGYQQMREYFRDV